MNQINLETLRSVEDTVEANEYTLQKAMTVLRGMTWGGMIYNAFAMKNKQHNTCNREIVYAANSSNATHFNERNYLLSSSSSQQLENISEEYHEEAALNLLLSSVTELRDISINMGLQIEQQSGAISRIEEKTDCVSDKTLAVVLKASQITQRMKNSHDAFIGMYQLTDVKSGYYLSVIDKDIVLIEKEDKSTFFECHVSQDNLYGLKNAKTLKYLSSTIWGPIKAVGESFGKREECHLSLDKENTGIFFLTTNWSYGGWLKRPSDINPDKNGLNVLDAVTSNLSDKKDIISFRLILSEEKKTGIS
jgi:hypothetical protein